MLVGQRSRHWRSAPLSALKLLAVSIHLEILSRARYLLRVIRAGFPSLRALVSALAVLIGGSVLLTVIWGIKHLAWAVAIVLLMFIGVVTEGSYRLSRDIAGVPMPPCLLRLYELAGEGDVMRRCLPTPDKRGIFDLPRSLLSDFEEWKASVAISLADSPIYLKRFQADMPHVPDLWYPSQDCVEIEHRTGVLDAIVEALKTYDLG